jgi:hypothetical protein
MNKWLRASAVLTLVALAMMVWSVLRPTPLPVMLAMSLGQAVGTAAFAIYGYIVLVDLRRIRRDARRARELDAQDRVVDVPTAEPAAAKPPEPES